MIWQCRQRRFDLTRRVLVMGILNVTPDSFSDGGKFNSPELAVNHALRLAAEGADILDIGGESSRPGAESVSVEEELRRVIPVIKAIRPRVDCAISVDTVKSEVARAALEAGADIINDISAMSSDNEMMRLAADAGAGVVLMHMKGDPRTMQNSPQYDDVVTEVKAFLEDRKHAAMAAGISGERIALDPGIGFGKTLDHNLELLRRLERFKALGSPLLVGVSRKSFIRKIIGKSPEDQSDDTVRLLDACSGSVQMAAILRGAAIIRAHDVASACGIARIAERLKV
ncbi:dihydropteroate synthase [Candidatus Sumerlaeota bacterium]|nr:dihydropteroate synthase [Candidatus Sumerlaeota bacterium]